MLHRYTSSGFYRSVDDVGALILPISWRMDDRRARHRATHERPWHDEELLVPLEAVAVEPDRVLRWDNDPTRQNSPKRIAYMLSSRAVPLVIAGGNGMQNVVDRLQNDEMVDEPGYDFSRIALARSVIAHLELDAGRRKGHHRSANLHMLFRYTPPQGDALEAFVEVLRGGEE